VLHPQAEVILPHRAAKGKTLFSPIREFCAGYGQKAQERIFRGVAKYYKKGV